MEEIRTMTLEEIEERRKAIAEEIPTADAERLTAINAELDLIEERKREIKAQAEERAKTVEEVLNAPAANPIIEKREEKKMTDREIRSTQEYVDAYVEYVKRGYKKEVFKEVFEKRASGSGTDWTNVITSTLNEDGMIPLPTYLEDRISTAWESNELMRRVRRSYLPGIVGVGVEVRADDAVIHSEGASGTGDVPTEELGIAFVQLIPEYVKKMVRITHQAYELNGMAFLDYLYDEIEYRIIKKCGDQVIKKLADNLSNVYTAAGADLTTADIIGAEGQLAGDANPVLITTRANAAALKAAALTASYGYDPFDGLEVIYCDTAALPHMIAVVADLDAVQCNFPDGAQPKFIFDEYTEAPANIVRIIGRLAMGCALISPAKVVPITPGA